MPNEKQNEDSPDYKELVGDIFGKIAKFSLFNNLIGDVKPHTETSISEGSHSSKEKAEVDASRKKAVVVSESSHTFSREVIIKAVDTREWIVYGVVMQPTASGELNKEGKFAGEVFSVDTDNEFTTEDEIRKSMISFMELLAKGETPHNAHHDNNQLPNTAIIENFQATEDMTFGGQEVVKGSWVQGVKVYDKQMRKDIEDGKISGFSVEGECPRASVAA